MRIAFLTQWFHPEPGALRGLPFAAWLARRGHDVRVITGLPNYPTGRIYEGYKLRLRSHEEAYGVSIVRVPLYPSHDGNAVRRIANYMSFAVSASVIGTASLHKPEVAYVYHPPASVGIAALTWKSLLSVPFVYHVADMWPDAVIESGMLHSPRAAKVIDRMLSKWCSRLYRKAAAITVISPGFKELLVERGVEEGKVEVVYNWADEDLFHPTQRDEALAASLGMSDRFNVVYAGNLGPFQALDVVVRAMERVRHLKRLQLVIIGTGTEEQALKLLARQRPNVRFLGRREATEMGQIAALADVLLVSLAGTPFLAKTIPSKTQISMAVGRPILMVARGDAADLVRRADAGLVCDPADEVGVADAIARLYALTREDLDEFGTRGRRFYVDNMSLDAGCKRSESVLARAAVSGA